MSWLQAIPSVERAEVYKGEVHAASLQRRAGGLHFAYLPGYGGPPVATTLPLGSVVETSGGAAPPFFAGLLPEGRRLTALRSAIKTSADDELSLLLAVGHDAIGDVRVIAAAAPLPPPPAPVEGPLDFRSLFARAVARDPEDTVGLPGVQDKVSGRMISLPVTWRGRSAILKLDPPEYPHLVENEAFFYGAAQRSGLPTARVEVIRDGARRAGLLVERFDRGHGTEASQRLAQEDGCQILGRYPADKYRVSTEELFEALAAATRAPLVAGRELLRQLAFAYLSCNGDAHAKNFSLLRRGGEWRVTPAYDLPCTWLYGDTTMALPIDGRRREDIGRRQLLALGRHLGLPDKATERVLDELLRAVPSWLGDLERLPFDGRRLHKLRRAIAWRCERLSG